MTFFGRKVCCCPRALDQRRIVVYLKVTPSNQTLILAGERDAFGDRPPAFGEGASSDSVLQRLTIVAARPNDTLWYVQADYQPASSLAVASDPTAASCTADSAAPAGLLALSPANSIQGSQTTITAGPRQTPRPTAGLLRGVGLYASTQNMLTDAPASRRLDVHA
jgi:hypothetical protein